MDDERYPWWRDLGLRLYATWDEWSLGVIVNFPERWLWVGIGPLNVLLQTWKWERPWIER